MKNKEFDYKLGMGAKKDKRDNRDYRIAGILPASTVEKQHFELVEFFPANNQYSRGSCTSQAQAHHKERQEQVNLSARFIMALTKAFEGNKEYGAYTRNTFKIVEKYGACRDDLMPEPDPTMTWEKYINVDLIPEACYGDAKLHKSQSYWRVDKSIDQIRQVLTEKGSSVVISMAWHKNFNLVGPNYGLLPDDFGSYVGGHAVEICGFDDFEEYFLIKNSWGESWGAGGFFRLPYKHFEKLVWDCWCSLDMPKDLPVDSRYGLERDWAGYMREKAIAFNPWLVKKIGRLPNNREISALAYGFWSYESVFLGKHGNHWLNMTKPEAKRRGLI